MADKRSYLDPKFEFELSKDAASWNWDLAKRKIQRVINQHQSDKEYAKEHPKERGLSMNKNTRSLLDKIDN